METTIHVSLGIDEAIETLDDAVINGSITGEKLDHYEVRFSDRRVVVMVYEKHFYRVGNRLTLTVTIDDAAGATRVHYVGGGGGEGLFRFDWGASQSFGKIVEDSLRPYETWL
jgi:hypothetical protein